MANPEHLKILKQGVDAWNKWRIENPDIEPDLTRANMPRADLSGADLSSVDLGSADLSGASLKGASLVRAKLVNTMLDKANLNKASVRVAEVIYTYMKATNLEDVDFSYSNLVGTNLTDANLTGIKLYGTSRDDWVIKDVECKYIYWDIEGKQRSPKDRNLEPREFERLYAALPTIEYIFENGMTPIDPLIMDRVVKAIIERKPEFGIKIDSINARGLAPSIKFTLQNEEHKKPALKEVKNEYEVKIKQLESERDRLYQLVAQALDAPKEVKLINAAPGSIVATDGSTVSFEQHIHNAIELQKSITDESEESESFAKVAKKTALEIIGEAIKDIAKGQVKEATKEIIELGKDLGPIIVKTAAYVFFKSIGS
ncbi:MAG: pentapeptide repeat-containing protein [Planctomycetes bacterium]|nr:pentapeptide repeat-containing protein [Planctomycetota bacterium]